jgi:hypothetical protein
MGFSMKNLRQHLLSLIFLGAASSALAQAPGTAAVVFLLIQPSLRANGMGGAAVASINNDAIGITFNPARLGVQALGNYFAAEFYPAKTAWLRQLAPDLEYDARTIFGGYNLKRLNKKIPVSVGVGYSRIFIDLGKQIITGEFDPTPIGTFHSTERANVWAFGIGFDYLLKAGIGWSFKDIESNLAPRGGINSFPSGAGKASAHDFGFVADLPVSGLISRFTGKPLQIGSSFFPSAGIGFGYSQSNIGDPIIYISAAQADPLARTARIGLSLNAGLSLSRNARAWRIFSLEHLYEAEQLLVRVARARPNKVTYEKWLGDIDFWQNVVLRKNNPKIITKSGWELSFFEIVSLRVGHYRDPLGKVDYNTSGVGISLHGLLAAIRYQQSHEAVIDFLINHFDLQYNYSNYDTEAGHPLSDTNFHGIGIRIF